MQQVWKGGISFGLVNIPVRLFAATAEGTGTSFHQVHAADGGRIRYRKVCEVDGHEVRQSDIARGVEAGGTTVVLTDDDLEHLPLPTKHTIELVSFVPADQIDPVQLGRAYYVQADPKAGADKPYVLLRDAMNRTDRVAIVRVALRSREHLATLRTHGDILVLQMLMWPDEVRDPAPLAPPAEAAVRGQEAAMAASLVESMAEDFHPEAHVDRYREAVREMVEDKLAGHERAAEEEGAGEAVVVDLMTALKASLEAAGRRPGGEGGAAARADTGTGRGPARKRAAAPSGDSGGDGRKAPRQTAAARERAEGDRAGAEAGKAEDAGKTGGSTRKSRGSTRKSGGTRKTAGTEGTRRGGRAAEGGDAGKSARGRRPAS